MRMLISICTAWLLLAGSFAAAYTPVIDPGHGGEDGGAVAKDGTVESTLNLDISLKLVKTLELFGLEPRILRTTDISLHSKGANTIREKKVSDLKNRVSAIQSIEEAFLISIHQNMFTQPKYSGAQVFYTGEESKQFAELLQEGLRIHLNPFNRREAKKASSDIYLLKKITCPAVLVECGFLSNPPELEHLRDPVYQRKLAFVIAAYYIKYLELGIQT